MGFHAQEDIRIRLGRNRHAQERMGGIGRQDNGTVPIGDGFQPLPGSGHLDKVRIGTAHKGLPAMRLEIIVQLALGLLYPIKRAEAQQVGLAHIGDESQVRLAYRHEMGDIVGMAGPHFNHGKLGPRINFQHRERDADIVVQVSLGRGHDIFGREDGADQLLGGRLAVGAGQAHDGETFPRYKGMFTMVTGQGLKGLQGVRYGNQAFVARCRRFRGSIDHGKSGPFFQGGYRIGIAIEILPFQGEKQFSALQGAAIGRHPRAAEEQRI